MIAFISSTRGKKTLLMRRGFTLVELLMAMAVSSILMVVLASMLQSSLTAYSGQQRRSSAAVESRAGLEILRSDLRSFCSLPDDPQRTGDDVAPRFVHLPGESALFSDRIAFLRQARAANSASVTATPDLGTLSLVAYAVGFTPDAGGRNSQKLYRRQFTPEETYVKLRNHLSTGAELLTEADWKTLTDPDPSPPSTGSGTDPDVPAPVVSVAEPVVYQVIQFKVNPLRALLSHASDPSSVNGAATLTADALWPSQEKPAAVDILLRVTNRGTAAKLNTLNDWRAEGNFQKLLLGQGVTPNDYSDDPEVETQQLRVHLPRY